MKTSTIPSVRIEPDLRKQLERVLKEGETLSSFVEASVRDAVHRRIDQDAFIARGLASLENAARTGYYIPAETVIAELQVRIDKARAVAARKRGAANGR